MAGSGTEMTGGGITDRMWNRITRMLIDTGRPPHYAELACSLGVSPAESRTILHVVLQAYPIGWLHPELDTLPSTMKKKICVILGAGASAVTRQTPEGAPQARRVMTENEPYVTYTLAASPSISYAPPRPTAVTGAVMSRRI